MISHSGLLSSVLDNLIHILTAVAFSTKSGVVCE